MKESKKLSLNVNDLRAIAEVNKIALKLKQMERLLKIRKDERNERTGRTERTESTKSDRKRY